MIYIHNVSDVENICNFVRKEIHGKNAAKKPTDKQVRNCKRYESEWFSMIKICMLMRIL